MPAVGWIVVLYLLTPGGEVHRAYTSAQSDWRTCLIAAEVTAARWHERRPQDRIFYGCRKVDNT